MAESTEFALLDLVQKYKAGKISASRFVARIRDKINFYPYDLTKALGKSGMLKAGSMVDIIAEYYGWDDEDMTLTESMKISKRTDEGLKIRSLSQMITENKGYVIDKSNPVLEAAAEGAVAWPDDEESKQAISTLNKWLYEILNNGGDNAKEEQHRNEVWYFSSDFKSRIKKALEIIDKLGLTDKMPIIVNWAKSNIDDEVPYLDKNASDAYKEMDNVSNWGDLQISSLDFIESEKNRNVQSRDDEDDDYYQDEDDD